MSKLKEKRNSFESLPSEINLGVGSLFKNISRVTCPCCGYPTLEERANYEICDLCNWEDDGQDDHDSAKSFGGPNGGYSLDEARENFMKYRTMYSPDNNTTITGADSEKRAILKSKLIQTFEEMLHSNTSRVKSLWKQALAIDKDLHKELERSIREYEKSIKH